MAERTSALVRGASAPATGPAEPREGPESGLPLEGRGAAGCPPEARLQRALGLSRAGRPRRGHAQPHPRLGAAVPTHEHSAMLRPGSAPPPRAGTSARPPGALGATKTRRPRFLSFHSGPTTTTIFNVTGKPMTHVPTPLHTRLKHPGPPAGLGRPPRVSRWRGEARCSSSQGHCVQVTSWDAGRHACENGVSPPLTTHSVKTMSGLIGAETSDVASNVQKTSLNPQMPPRDRLCRSRRQRSAK